MKGVSDTEQDYMKYFVQQEDICLRRKRNAP